MQPGTVGTATSRILVLLSQVFVDGGIQRFNRTFLSACDGLGATCDVLSLNDGEDSRNRWQAPASATIRLFNRNKSQFALATCAAVLRGEYDFIVIGHINLLPLVSSCASLRKPRGTRLLLIAHGIEVWTGLDKWRLRLAATRLDLILCVSRYTRDRIQEQWPRLPEQRYTIFPNALSETWVQRFAQSDPVQTLAGLPRRFLLSVTRLDRGDRYKGITTVIETLAALEDRSVHYVIAGQGDDRVFLERMAERFQVSGRVHFVGSVSDAELANLYAQCAAFILPSGKEGFGIVFLEAMYFGAPVIAAREKGAIDVVRDEETGLLVPYGDTAALAGVIMRILQDGALRTRLRMNGRQSVSVEGPFSFRSYMTRLATIFQVELPVTQ